MSGAFVEEFKNWLEIIYFFSGPAIAFIAYLALGQIRIAKEQMQEQKKALKITSKRDALKLTADQVTIYTDKIIPLQNILDIKLKSLNVEILEKFTIEFDSNAIKLIPPKEEIKLGNFESFGQEFLDVANAMESFSTYFMSGVADEKIAYLSLGTTFCNTMKKISPILIPLSNGGRSFTATLSLYSIWGQRLEREALTKQKVEIDQKLKSNKKVSISVVGEED